MKIENHEKATPIIDALKELKRTLKIIHEKEKEIQEISLGQCLNIPKKWLHAERLQVIREQVIEGLEEMIEHLEEELEKL